MGYIYMIQNDINDKKYIGKTQNDISKRFRQHLRDHNKRRCEKRPLYSAMKKYGTSHFYVTELQKCDNDILCLREQYWIEKYNSYHNGYNATKGGDGKSYVDYNNILLLIQQGKAARDVAKEIGCCVDVVYKTMKQNGFNARIASNNKVSKPCIAYDINGTQVMSFPSRMEAGRWCVKNCNTRTTNPQLAAWKINECLSGAINKAFGLVWKEANPRT